MLCAPWIDAIPESCTAEAVSADLLEEALAVASSTLYLATGRVYSGECSAVLRPCSPPILFDRLEPMPWYPIRTSDGSWLNLSTACDCHIDYACGCNGIPQVDLGRNDVRSVTEVLIDGDVLDTAAYRLDERRLLVRIDGGWWPCCQDLAKPSTEVGTWEISLTYGTMPPRLLQRAAEILACEYVKAEVDPEECQLPLNTVTVIRQGITMELLPLDGQATGVPAVDSIVRQVNPDGLTRSGEVWSPDFARHRQT